jgi:hypothetical protein
LWQRLQILRSVIRAAIVKDANDKRTRITVGEECIYAAAQIIASVAVGENVNADWIAIHQVPLVFLILYLPVGGFL